MRSTITRDSAACAWNRRARRRRFGSVVHAMVLGAGREWHVIDADDWRTKAAKAERDAAESVGKVPILRPMFERAEGMAAALSSGLRALPLVDMALALGEPEVVCIWRESVQVGNDLVTVWCRSMMDLCPTGIDDDGWLTIYDLKTTQVALDPVTLARKMVSDGNDVQAEWYTRGLLEVLRVPASAIHPRARFRFLFAESDPPHLCVAVACSGAMESIGAAKVQAGCPCGRAACTRASGRATGPACSGWNRQRSSNPNGATVRRATR